MQRLPLAALVLALAVLAPSHRAEAQLGALKKKLKEATGGQPKSTGEVVKFDNVTLELTPERIAQVVAGKKAGKAIAEGPDGPPAIQKKIDALDERQAAIYNKQVNQINGFDERRRSYEQCLDSALTAIQDRMKSAMTSKALSDPGFVQRLTKLSFDMQAAMQKHDTAGVRKIQQEIERMQAPSAADSAEARAACKGPPAPPAVVKEWLDLKDQIEVLRPKLAAAEEAVQKAEQDGSGMTDRQLAVACERMLFYITRYEAKQQQVGFTTAELEALEKALSDYKGLCR